MSFSTLNYVSAMSEDKAGWPWTVSSGPFATTMPSGAPWPRISIVTPSFNQGKYLEETVRSVLQQNYPNLDYIIIDGGSLDQSPGIIRRYESQLTYWVSETDKGQADALNKGFARATGELFGFLNSDDVYQPGTLARAAQAYCASHDRDRFWHAYAVEDFDSHGTRMVNLPKLEQRLADWVDNKASLHQPGVFWSRHLHHDVGGFNSELQFAFDRQFFATAVLKGYRLTVDPEFVSTRFRYHDESKTVTVGYGTHWGFAGEFIKVSQKLQLQASLVQKARIVLGRLGRQQQAIGETLLKQNSGNRISRLGRLLLAGLAYPPNAARRFYWGALRQILFVD